MASVAEHVAGAGGQFRGVDPPVADHGHPVAAGAPANLVLVDPTATASVDRDASQSLSRNTPWHGQSLTGAVHTTILRGRVTARGGEPTAC